MATKREFSASQAQKAVARKGIVVGSANNDRSSGGSRFPESARKAAQTTVREALRRADKDPPLRRGSLRSAGPVGVLGCPRVPRWPLQLRQMVVDRLRVLAPHHLLAWCLRDAGHAPRVVAGVDEMLQELCGNSHRQETTT